MALPSSQPVTSLVCGGHRLVSRGRVADEVEGRPGPGGCPWVGDGSLCHPTMPGSGHRAPPSSAQPPPRRLLRLTRSRGLLGLCPVLGSQRLLWKGSTTSPRLSGSNTGSPGGMWMLRNSAGQPGLSTLTRSESTW